MGFEANYGFILTSNSSSSGSRSRHSNLLFYSGVSDVRYCNAWGTSDDTTLRRQIKNPDSPSKLHDSHFIMSSGQDYKQNYTGVEILLDMQRLLSSIIFRTSSSQNTRISCESILKGFVDTGLTPHQHRFNVAINPLYSRILLNHDSPPRRL